MKRLLFVSIVIALLMISCGLAPASPPPTDTLPPPPDTAVPPAEPTAVPTDPPLPPTDAPAPTNTTVPATEAAPPPTQPPAPLALSSSAFQADQHIPVRHACHGENLSPPLAWTQPPPGTQSFALVMDDPDAVAVAGYVWDHWLLFNIPADVLSLPEGLPRDGELPDGSRQGMNSNNALGYGGPCPPGGQTHGYVFTLYALDTLLELNAGASKGQILEALDGHILDQAVLVGRYTSP